MTTDLREKIAEVLAGHDVAMTRDRYLVCFCEEWRVVTTGGPLDAEVGAYREHVAEAILAAIGEWLQNLAEMRDSSWLPVDHSALEDHREVVAQALDALATRITQPSTEEAVVVADVRPCPEGFHWIGQTWSACDKCGLPASQHAGMAVTATPMKSPFDDQPLVLRPWTTAEQERTT